MSRPNLSSLQDNLLILVAVSMKLTAAETMRVTSYLENPTIETKV